MFIGLLLLSNLSVSPTNRFCLNFRCLSYFRRLDAQFAFNLRNTNTKSKIDQPSVYFHD